MANMTPWVRRYTLYELLDDGFDLCKELGAPLLLAGGLPCLALILYMAIMRIFVVPGDFSPKPGEFWSTLADHPALLFYLLGLLFLSMVVGSVALTAQCRLATRQALGEPLRLRAAFRKLAKPTASLFIVMLIAIIFLLVAAVVGLFAGGIVSGLLSAIFSSTGPSGMIIPRMIGGISTVILVLLALAMAGALFLAAPLALAMDHCGPFTAVGKSFKIAAANFTAHWFSCAFMLLIPLLLFTPWIIILQLQQGESLHFSPALMEGISSLFLLVGTVVSFAVFAGYMSLVYLDGRCRLEHYDLLLLAHDLGMGEQVEQDLRFRPAGVSAQSFPNYAVAGSPNYAAAAPSAFPDYTAVPAVTVSRGLATPAASAAYPDYASAPVDQTAPDLADPAVPAAFPDYASAPVVQTASALADPADSTPLLASAPAPALAAEAFPDYSAPPPPTIAPETPPADEEGAHVE